MKKEILRNIALVSAVFIVTLSIMLITNYFQVRGTTPLQTEVIETLKQLNDENANNPVLQEQIRQLDLLARKAYFVQMDHLMAGVYILLGMLTVCLVCVRLYFAREKDIPGKAIDPVDEWAIKTHARRYITWGTVGLAIVALLFAVLSSPYLMTRETTQSAEQPEILAESNDMATLENSESLPQDEVALEDTASVEAVERTDTVNAAPAATDILSAQPAPQVAVSKVTHNAFRGNNSNGQSSAKGVPVKWNLANKTNIAWKQDIPRQGQNSPVINGNNVFFSGADDQARELFCYDLTTGEKRWTVSATNIPGSPAQMPRTTPDTGLASSTVATNGKQVCAIFATGDIICADMDGKRLWAKNLGVPSNHYGYASSLLVYGNTVIVQYDNTNTPRVIALDFATGNERWSKTRPEKITWSSPMIAQVNGSPQLVLMGNPGITAYNPGNGEQLWRVECLTGEVGASACSSNGLIFGASEYSKLVAINGADGKVLWESDEFLPEVSSPVATKDNVYLATSYGVAASFDALTGELRKEHELNTEFYASPMLVEGKIFLFSNEGKMHIFSADNEFRLLDVFDTGERTMTTPAFTDGKIVVRTEKSIYCVTAN